ncbi:helix-turn-helix domain-containing protein [Streptomyces sp. NPDC052016]|uniref:helix-turn-helix domain-containing protein n=1 Tax=unclassified Streptomyces TaxID=2593676 RepID=UPI0034134E0A
MTVSGRVDGTETEEAYDEVEQLNDLNRAVGKQLRLLRERAGLMQRDVGDRLGYGPDLISALERGVRTPQREFLQAVDELLDAGGLLKALAEDVERAKSKARVRHPAWFKDYARLEKSAVEINFYNNHDVPGLLQTERRTRALYVMRKPVLDPDTVEQRVASRVDRQDILTRRPLPVVTAVIEEVVLRRPLGGWDIHQEQLRHLLKLGRLPNVELQVMPSVCSEHAGMGGPFVLLAPKGKPQVGYTETQSNSNLITEPEEVRMLAARYGSIRAQALTMQESLALIESLLGER